MRRLLLLFVLAALAVAACSNGDADLVRGTVTATPLPATRTPSPSPSPTPSPSPSPTATGTRAPTDADRARFVAAYEPDGAAGLRDLAADLDADGVRELLFFYVASGTSHVDVATWTGTRYEIVEQARGGPADDLDDVRVTDLNATDVLEIAVFQTVGGAGESVSLWTGEPGGRLRPLVAEGGCFDGSHTYGDTGAEVSDRDGDGLDEVRAVCEQANTPEPLWPTDVYLWSGQTYRCDHRVTSSGQQAPCDGDEPTPTASPRESPGSDPPASEDPG